jgi:CheY-like chemotaxis protein
LGEALEKILIVDDVQVNVILLTELLKHDYEIIKAYDGNQAVEMAKSNLPDLILLDIMMPELDGYDACKLLKSDPQTKNIPIMFITAYSDEKNEEYALSLGAVDFITKPFLPALVKARIKTHLENNRYSKELALLLKKSEEAYAELKKTQEKLVQSEQKNAVFALAVTANHEINQPLMVISGTMELLSLKVNNPDYDKYFQKITSSIERIQMILNQFKELDDVNFKSYLDSVKMLDLQKDN